MFVEKPHTIAVVNKQPRWYIILFITVIQPRW